MKLEEIKTGDYLYYTERPFSEYADSLIHVRNVDGVDMAHPVCTNYNGEYINDTGRDDWSNDLPVAAYFDERCWFPTDYKEEYGDPAAWMAENFPLSA
jgi:hypothetical protein